MANSAIATDLGQTLDIESGLSSEVAFHQEVMVNALTELGFFLIRKIFNSSVRIDTGFFENLFCAGSADAVDIGKAYLYSLIFGQVNAGYTCHTVSSFLSNNYSALVRTETWSRRRESPFPAGGCFLLGVGSPASVDRCRLSALSLFVFGIFADYHDSAFALNDLAFFAHRLHGRSYFH